MKTPVAGRGFPHVCRPAEALGDATTFTCEVCGTRYERRMTWFKVEELDL